MTIIKNLIPSVHLDRSAAMRILFVSAILSLSLACRRQHPLNPYIAYVVNQQSATLTAVNLADFHVTASLPVAAQPERVLLRPHSRQHVVSASRQHQPRRHSPRSRLATPWTSGRSAHDLQFSPDGRAAYVLDPADHEVVFIDSGATGGDGSETAVPRVAYRLRLEGTLRDLALSPDGKTLVAASAKPNQIAFISTEMRSVVGTTGVGESPGPIVILPDSSKVFVANSGEEKISASALSPNKLFAHIEIGTRPTALILKPDGGEIFALATQSSTLIIVDAFHDNVERTIPLGGNPVAGIFRADMSVLYIANAGDGSVLALDGQTREVMASTHVGMAPSALALTPDQRLLVVADRAASSLAILQADPASMSNDRSVLITTIPVGVAPVDVIVPEIEAVR